MPKYWGKQIFTHGSFPEVGQKQKMRREREREKEEQKSALKMDSTKPSYAKILGETNFQPREKERRKTESW